MTTITPLYTDVYLGHRVVPVLRRQDGCLLMELAPDAVGWTFASGTVERDELPYEAAGRVSEDHVPFPRMAGGLATLNSLGLDMDVTDEDGVPIHASVAWGWDGEPPAGMAWVRPSVALASPVAWVREIATVIVRAALGRPHLFGVLNGRVRRTDHATDRA